MRRALTIAVFLIYGFLAAGAVDAAVVYVRHHSGPVFDGLSWSTAYDTIQAGVDSASSGDEVWTAEGTYAENVALKSGVALYGGFAGSETLRTQRDWRIHVSKIDGGRCGSAVEVARDADAATRIDGFTITNGRAVLGGGIYCNQRSLPTVADNVITGNTAHNDGGGIYCNIDSAPIVVNNRISNNSAAGYGGGVRTTTGPTVIAGCVISCNSALCGGGICGGDPSALSHEDAMNNTIFANSAVKGGGIYCLGNSAIGLANNIVAFNSSGIHKESGAGVVALKNNCVHGNDGGDYTGLARGSTDIGLDPKLASARYGNLHIQPGSPCKDAGNSGEILGGWPDIDGQARVIGVVDIGADESDGTTWTVNPVIVRVTPDGNDANDGSEWDSGHAKHSIQAAVNAAAQVGGEVWAAAGFYDECVALRDYVYVYGGFAGWETSASQRDWRTNASVVDAQSEGPVVSARQLGHRTSALDGFSLTNGRAFNGGGVLCDGASPVIANNTITSNTSDNKGGGVYLFNSSAAIESNTISSDSALASGGGVCCDQSAPDIVGNSIQANSACLNGCGIYFSPDSAGKLVNNRIVENHENTTIAGAWGGGVSLGSYCSPDMVNNTTSDNSSGSNGGGLYCNPFGSVSMSNSVTAFNSSGLWVDDASSVSSVRKNCVYSNGGYNYLGFSGGTGDIVLNPLFVDRSAADYHLGSGSPCIETADASLAPAVDIDGDPRPLDGDGNHVSAPDIGCYEYARGFSDPREAKSFQDGDLVAVTGLVSTARWTGLFYLERPDGASGIGVQGSCSGLGVSATVEGTMTTVGGERLISAYNVIEAPALDMPQPWYMPLRTLGGGPVGLQPGIAGGAGLGNIALLVRVFGRVVDRDASQPPLWFGIDDGSGVGVRVVVPSGAVLPTLDSSVVVTGISSCEESGGVISRLIRVRSQDDIVEL